MKIDKKPWESKKWIAAVLGLAVLTVEVMFAVNLPDELIIAQGVTLLGYLLGQSYVDATTNREALRVEAAKLDLEGSRLLAPRRPTEPDPGF